MKAASAVIMHIHLLLLTISSSLILTGRPATSSTAPSEPVNQPPDRKQQTSPQKSSTIRNEKKESTCYHDKIKARSIDVVDGSWKRQLLTDRKSDRLYKDGRSKWTTEKEGKND